MNRIFFTFFTIFFIAFSHSFAQTRTLDFFINNATTNSPVLNEIQNQILSNRVDSQILIASQGLQVIGNGNSFYAPVYNGYGYDAAITNGGQLQALVTVSKNFLSKKFLSLQFYDLQLAGDSLRNSAKIIEQEVKKSIIAQYIITYGDQLQLDFNDQLINLLSGEETILKKITISKNCNCRKNETKK